jgi:DNA N-6-adenine-methyltransferase (Dam)
MDTAVAKKADEGALAIYDPERGLQTVVTAEASEKHWLRAKDTVKLFIAIEAKITAQAEYVCWRDGKVTVGRPKKNSRASTAILPATDPGQDIIDRWRKDFCHKGETGTIIDKEKFALALDDAKARALRAIERMPKGTERGTAGTGEYERYTPAFHIEAARLVLGTIDVDPASNPMAQETVKATTFFSQENDGLTKEWHGNVWLNPPYHRALQPLFVDKLVAEVKAGRVKQAIMLTNNSTDTEWFRIAAEASNAICFTIGRVGFTTPSGEEVAPTQGQAFFYYGENTKEFMDVFAPIGFGVVVVWASTKVKADE